MRIMQLSEKIHHMLYFCIIMPCKLVFYYVSSLDRDQTTFLTHNYYFKMEVTETAIHLVLLNLTLKEFCYILPSFLGK